MPLSLKSRRRRLAVAAVLVAPLVLILTVAWAAGTSLSAPARRSVGALPADLRGRVVEFESASGARIRGWLLPGGRGAGTVVLMHGVRGSRLNMLGRARFLSAAGYTVLLFDFQAHGESEGSRITTGYLESRDARAAVDFVRAGAPGERVGVLGVSMGGAAALLAEPPLDVDALVLEMVYPTIEQAIDDRLRMSVGAWGVVFRPLLTSQLRLRLGISADDLHPIDHAPKVTAPKLFVAGAEDGHTTLAESRQLFDAASGPKEFWVIDGARHQDLHALKGREYEERVLAFLDKHLRR
ncbi:MAG TPA: alpha/beta fold hydrolase [Pyrinomonadaceae bacterium]|jgi:alpha-beta hydrolase superfamily lysophospholipase|nr:alpha/beta fold hydrolase [Pyrinomonadaceae bacterium]